MNWTKNKNIENRSETLKPSSALILAMHAQTQSLFYICKCMQKKGSSLVVLSSSANPIAEHSGGNWIITFLACHQSTSTQMHAHTKSQCIEAIPREGEKLR